MSKVSFDSTLIHVVPVFDNWFSTIAEEPFLELVNNLDESYHDIEYLNGL